MNKSILFTISLKRVLPILLFIVVGIFNCFGQGSGNQWLDLNYAGDDQVYHNLDIYLPDTNESTHKHKAIVVIYGSAWFGNNMKQAAYNTYGKYLLNSGFAVIAINHRASTDALYPAQINDVKAAIRFVRAHAELYKIDESFIGITGFSSGGHLASLAGATNGVKEVTINSTTVNIEGDIGAYTDYSSSVHAVVDWFGPIDMSLMDKCENPKGNDSPEAVLLGGNPSDHLDMIALLNPITFLDEADPPFLVIHGDADNVVPYCQSILFAKALQEKGLLKEFISVSKGQHGPITFNESTFEAMVRFFLEEAEKSNLNRQ